MYNSEGRFSSNCGPIWLYTAVPSLSPFPNVILVAPRHLLVSGLYSSLLAQFFLSSLFTPLTKPTYFLVFLPFTLNAQIFPILFLLRLLLHNPPYSYFLSLSVHSHHHNKIQDRKRQNTNSIAMSRCVIPVVLSQ